MSIRRASIDDAIEMDRINRLVLPENYPLDFWTTVLNVNHSSNYVIEVDGHNHNEEDKKIIVGYVLGAVEEDNQKRLKGHVYSIGVLPQYTRKGYGGMLLTSFENDLIQRFGVKKVTLHVRKTNKGAITFYNRNDYSRVKKVKEYYGKGNDGFLFEKVLY